MFEYTIFMDETSWKIRLIWTLKAVLTLLACVTIGEAHADQTRTIQSPAANSVKPRSSCSRPQSKFVREYFARALLPIYTNYGVPVPEKCPFSPLHDIYHYHENNKTKVDVHRWKCEMCGKFFLSEYFLDRHFDRKHRDSLQMTSNSVCLASYCRMFRCDYLMNLDKPPATKKAKCYESTMVNLNKRCQTHLDLCIPRGIPYNVQNKLTNELRENLCSYLTCTRYHELPSYMSKGPNFLTVFCVVVFAGLCIIAYGVINHTDLIFDENEVVPQNNLTEYEKMQMNTLKSINTQSKDSKTNANKRVNFNLAQNQFHHVNAQLKDAHLFSELGANYDSELRHRANAKKD